MIYAEVLAGGSGTRMGNTEMPKQFLKIGNKPIFIHTVEQFIFNKRIEKVLICCPEQWISYTKDTLKKYPSFLSPIHINSYFGNILATSINISALLGAATLAMDSTIGFSVLNCGIFAI